MAFLNTRGTFKTNRKDKTMKKYSIIALTAFIASFAPALQAISVQDLIGQHRIRVHNGILNLRNLNIDSLNGLQNIPNPLLIKTINLSSNKISKLKLSISKNLKYLI